MHFMLKDSMHIDFLLLILPQREEETNEIIQFADCGASFKEITFIYI